MYNDIWKPPPVAVRGTLVHGFANALPWRYELPARRHLKFPGWPYVGWKGALHSDCKDTRDLRAPHTTVVLAMSLESCFSLNQNL